MNADVRNVQLERTLEKNSQLTKHHLAIGPAPARNQLAFSKHKRSSIGIKMESKFAAGMLFLFPVSLPHDTPSQTRSPGALEGPPGFPGALAVMVHNCLVAHVKTLLSRPSGARGGARGPPGAHGVSEEGRAGSAMACGRGGSLRSAGSRLKRVRPSRRPTR